MRYQFEHVVAIPQPCLGIVQEKMRDLVFRLVSAAHLECHRDKITHARRERRFLVRPDPISLAAFMTDGTVEYSTHTSWGVDHGMHAKASNEVREDASMNLAWGITFGPHTAEGAHILEHRHIGVGINGQRFLIVVTAMDTIHSVPAVKATQGDSIGAVAPNADAFNVKRPGSALADNSNRFFERAVGVPDIARQIDQGARIPLAGRRRGPSLGARKGLERHV
ncbi:MAG: hypothetical protein WBP11_08510 [Dokdonella sp.]